MVIKSETAQSAEALAAELGVSSENCGARNFLTMRKTCIGSDYVAGSLKIYLLYAY